MRCLGHVPRHHQQQRGQRGHRQVAEQRREQQHGGQHHPGMDDRRQRRERSGAHAGGGAGDGCGGGDAAEQRGHQVADALADQLAVGVVLAAAHAIGDHRAEQRLDGTEHGDGHRRGEQLADQRQTQRRGIRQLPGQGEARQVGRNAGMHDAIDRVAETLAEGRHRQAAELQQQAEQGADRQRGEMAGHLRHQTRPGDQHAEGRHGDQRIAGAHAGQGQQQVVHLLGEVRGAAGHAEAEGVLELQAGDDDADPGGEAKGHRIGHELDQLAGAQHAESDEDQPGEHRAQQQAGQAVLLDDGQEDHHEGRGGAGDVEARAAAQGDQRRGDQHRVQAVLRRCADRDGQCHRQRDGDDPDGQSGEDVAAQCLAAIAGLQGLTPGGEQRDAREPGHAVAPCHSFLKPGRVKPWPPSGYGTEVERAGGHGRLGAAADAPSPAGGRGDEGGTALRCRQAQPSQPLSVAAFQAA